MGRRNNYNAWWIFAITILLALPFISKAEAEEIIHTIEKTYSLTPSDILEIKNKYGKVEVNTWEKHHTTVKITIISRASNPDKAESRLGEVAIRERSFGQKIQLETRIDGNNLLRFGTNSGLKVNYEINLPAGNPLEIENKFGDIILGVREGNVDVDLAYGDFYAEKLSGAGNTLHLQFGKAEIRYFNSGDIDFSFGELRMEEAETLYLKSNASIIAIKQIQSLELYANLGEIRVDEVGEVAGNYTSSKFTIGKLNQSLNMDVKYAAKFEVREIGAEVESIDLDGNFSSFDLYVDPNANFDLDANLENGGLIVNDSWLEIDSIEIEKNQTRYQSKGTHSTTRTSRPPMQVRVQNKYGTVRVLKKE